VNFGEDFRILWVNFGLPLGNFCDLAITFCENCEILWSCHHLLRKLGPPTESQVWAFGKVLPRPLATIYAT
jgi:hypothetical protein